MPTVSVIIPSYNCAGYVGAAIQSVLDQTYKDLEIIVVDDGSTDDTPNAVEPYLDRIRYIRQPNKGLPGARNTGIRASRGEYVALLDADDTWLPEKLAIQMPMFSDPEVGIAYSDFAIQHSDGKYRTSYLADEPLASEGYIIESYLRAPYLYPSTMVFRREAMEKCGYFDEEMLVCEDIELFTRICLRWKAARAREVLMIRQEGPHNITANRDRIRLYTIRAFHKILSREPDLSPDVRRLIHQQLAQKYWWHGYLQFKRGETREARQNMISAIRHDSRNLRKSLKFLVASILPNRLLSKAGVIN